MGVDVPRVGGARFQQAHPETVELQPSTRPQIEGQVLGEGAHVMIEPPLEIGEGGGSAGQVIQRGIGGVAAIALGPTPSLPRKVLSRQHLAGLLKIGVEGREIPRFSQRGFIEAGDEEFAELGHGV